MTPSIAFNVPVKDAVLQFEDWHQREMNTFCREREGKVVTVQLSDLRSIRSLEQNRLYWKIVGLIADHSGHSKNAIHTYLKREYLGMEPREVFGQVVEEVPSTTELTIKEMTAYLEQVIAFAGELGIVVPLPNQA